MGTSTDAAVRSAGVPPSSDVAARTVLFLKTCNQHPAHQSSMAELFIGRLPGRGYVTRFVQLADCDEEHPRVERLGGSLVLNVRIMRRRPGLGWLAGVLNRLAYAWVAWREAARIRAAVIHVRQFTYGLWLGLIVARLRGAVLSYHEVFPFDLLLREKLRGARGCAARLRLWLGTAEDLVKRWCLRRADLFLVISETMRARYLERGLAARGDIEVLPLGVDVEAPVFSQVDQFRSSRGSAAPRVAYLGTLDALRQPALMIEAADWVRRREPRVTFDFVGGLPSQIDGLRAHAERLGCASACRFTGWLPRPQALAAVAAADVGLSIIPPTEMFVVSSPTKLLEMMALEMPIVANRGIPEQEYLVEESGCGILTGMSAEAIGAAILRLLEDRPLREAMGAAGRAFVARHRSYETMARELGASYDRAALGRRPPCTPRGR